MAPSNTICLACSNKLDLFSVHEELWLDGNLWLQNNAADLVKYCFDMKIKFDLPYSMCPVCLNVLIQASSFKEKLLSNMDLYKEQKRMQRIYNDNYKCTDAVNNEMSGKDECSEDDFSSRDFETKNGETDSTNTEYMCQYIEIIHQSDESIDGEHYSNKECRTTDQDLKTRKDLIAKKEQLIREINSISNNKIMINISENDTIDEPIEILKNNAGKKVFQKSSLAKNCGEKSKLSEKVERLNVSLKREFQSLRQNCKNFGLFSWFRSKFKCAVCEKLFTDKITYKKHAKKHKTKDFDNVYPKGDFYNGPDLKVDISSMKCRHCGVRVKEIDVFRDHLSSSHNVQCENLFQSILPFNLTEDEFKCGICSAGFKNMVRLNVHMNEHSTSYGCDHCGKHFVCARRLKNHIRNLHVTGAYKCTKCDEIFETNAKRGYHMARVHSGVQHLCQHCRKSFKNFHLKVKHLAEAHNEKLKKYECESCPSAFMSGGELSIHTQRVHLQERNHTCWICEYACFNLQELNNHIVTHTGEKSFVCDVCHKAVGRRKSLIEHLRIHNDERRYKCRYCERAFVHLGSLKAHFKTHENNNKK